MVGKVVSHYRVETRLGEGGMGVVYAARDLRLDRRVALKFVSSDLARDPLIAKRFQREARAASALNHPHICTIYEVDEHDGIPFLVMELLEGSSLSKLIAGHPVKTENMLDWGMQIADAVQTAHASGIVHRDIKPGNIFITDRGQVKVLDFGLAKVSERKSTASQTPTATYGTSQDSSTASGQVLGTLSYMSPEQVRGERVDARSDIFSLGIVLYEMATGRQAFSGPTSGVIFDGILNKTPVSPVRLNPDLPSGCEAIVNKALEKSREMRYQSAADVKADLARLKRDSNQLVPLEIDAAKRSWFSRVSYVFLVLLLTGALSIALSKIYPAPPETSVEGLAQQTIAVLPFENPNTGDYADALTEDMINDLGQLRGIRVTAHSVSKFYKGRKEDPHLIGEQLRVKNILTGKVWGSATGLTIQVELIDTSSGLQMWSAEFSGDPEAYGVIREQILRGLVDKLHFKVPKEDWQRLHVRNYAAIGGTVYDRNKDPMLGATVCLTNTKGIGRKDFYYGFTTLTTGNDGSYMFDDLVPGKYELAATRRYDGCLQDRFDVRHNIILSAGEYRVVLPPLHEPRNK